MKNILKSKILGGGVLLAALLANVSYADDSDSRITTYKNNGLLPANFVAPTVSNVDAGDVVTFSPQSLSWVSDDAESVALRAEFTAYYDMTKEEWLAMLDAVQEGDGAFENGPEAIKFLGLVQHGKITDAAISASDIAQIASKLTGYCFEFGDFSDVQYWPTLSTIFYECSFGDGVPTAGTSTFTYCNFEGKLPVGKINGAWQIGENAVAQLGTVFINTLPEDWGNVANPEVVACEDIYFPNLVYYDISIPTIDQLMTFRSLLYCTLPDNVVLTHAQAEHFGISSNTNYLGSNSYIED